MNAGSDIRAVATQDVVSASSRFSVTSPRNSSKDRRSLLNRVSTMPFQIETPRERNSTFMRNDGQHNTYILIRRIVKSNTFQTTVAVTILANAAIIGLETDAQKYMWLWDQFEFAFLLIFTAEISLRLYVQRWAFFEGREVMGNAFDASLVVVGVVDCLVTLSFGSTLGPVQEIIDTCRLLRIIRLFRLFKMFKQLYMLASGFLESSFAVFWVAVLTSIILYVCAIFMTQTLRERPSHVRENFDSVPRSMFSLFMLMANPEFDDLQTVMFDSPATLVFFIIFIIFASFAMVAILTGVISESMVTQGSQHQEEMRFEEERERKLFMAELLEHFKAADEDGDGTLDRAEFLDHVPALVSMFKKHGFSYGENEMTMVFDLVDLDKGGTVVADEFVNGMTSFTANVNDMPIEFLRLSSSLFTSLDAVSAKKTKRLHAVEARYTRIEQRLLGIESLLQEVERKLEAVLNLSM